MRCGLVTLSPPRQVPVLIFGRDVDGKIGHVSPILDKPSLQSLFTRPSTDGTFGFALSSCDSDISARKSQLLRSVMSVSAFRR